MTHRIITYMHRLRKIQGQLKTKTFSQVKVKVQKETAKFKKLRKKVPGAQKRGQSLKKAPKYDLIKENEHLVERLCAKQKIINELEAEKLKIESELKRLTVFDCSEFKCSICHLKIDAQVRIICIFCPTWNLCEPCHIHSMNELDLQHSHPEHASNSVVRLVRRDPMDPMAIHINDGNENEDIQCV